MDGIFTQVRRLPVGDGIWIVRHRESNNEYVLDFIVERKKVDDLCSSIKDNRYRDQKLRLQVLVLICICCSLVTQVGFWYFLFFAQIDYMSIIPGLFGF